jgi:hypothetical protein
MCGIDIAHLEYILDDENIEYGEVVTLANTSYQYYTDIDLFVDVANVQTLNVYLAEYTGLITDTRDDVSQVIKGSPAYWYGLDLLESVEAGEPIEPETYYEIVEEAVKTETKERLEALEPTSWILQEANPEDVVEKIVREVFDDSGNIDFPDSVADQQRWYHEVVNDL